MGRAIRRLTLICFPLAALAGITSATVLAQENFHYTCKLELAQRTIAVAYLVPEQAVPCEVQYTKNDTEPQLLWRADNQEGYCEEKVRQVVKEHEALGFSCEATNLPEQLPGMGNF